MILMPEDAPAGKVAATPATAPRSCFSTATAEDARSARRARRKRGLVPVHPYDDQRVMAGQGTAALELLEDAGPLDLLLVCVGGGGLLPGCATATAALRPDTRSSASSPRRATIRAVAGGGRARADRGPADDRRRPAVADARRAHVPGHPGARARGRHRLRCGDRRRHALLFERAKTSPSPAARARSPRCWPARSTSTGLRVGVTLSGGNTTAARSRCSSAQTRGARDRPRLRGAARGLERSGRGRRGHARHRRGGDAHRVVAFAIPAAFTWRHEQAIPTSSPTPRSSSPTSSCSPPPTRAPLLVRVPVARGSAPVLVLAISVIALARRSPPSPAVDVSPSPSASCWCAASGPRRSHGARSSSRSASARASPATRRRRSRHRLRQPDPVFEIVLLAAALPYAPVIGPQRSGVRSTAARCPPAWPWRPPTCSCSPRSNGPRPRPSRAAGRPASSWPPRSARAQHHPLAGWSSSCSELRPSRSAARTLRGVFRRR